MSSRTVEVTLKANIAQYNAALDAAAARTTGLSKSVKGADVDVRHFSNDVNTAGNDLDRFSGRVRLFLETTALIGPGLLPIGAVGVPAVAGLASQLTIAALAGGSAVVAFQGVGDAVKAMSAYKLDPTVDNLQKAQEALAALGPDAGRFVMEFQEFIPVLHDIRDAAAAGWFPGLTESLEHFEELAPRVMSLFKAVGQAGGDAVAGGAESLAGERWEEFFSFLEREAPEVLTDLAGIVGDLTHGATEMWQAFDPGNDAFTDWVGDVADGFDQWASSAEGRRDIASFLDYVSETGPDVAELFTSLVGMLVQVTQAAAPLGGPVLDGLTAVSDVIGVIADSDLGTPILVGVAALSAYNRALSITAALQKTAFGQKHLQGGALAQIGAPGGISAMVAQAKAGIPTMSQFGTVAYRLGQSTSYASKETLAARNSVRSFTGGLARGAAPIAGFAALTSGLADDIGLTNTMSLGLMGTMLGPWGAALGTGAGFVLDVKSASDEASDSIDRWNAALDENAANLGGQRSVLADARDELAAFTADVESANMGEQLSNWLDPKAYANAIEGLFGDSNVEEKEAAWARMRREVELNELAVIKLGQAMGTDVRQSIFGGVIDEKVTALLERTRPAMDALGYSLEDLYAAARNERPGSVWAPFVDEGELDRMTTEAAALTRSMESTHGRTVALAEAIALVGDEETATAVSAAPLSTALDALLDPALNAEEATHAWRASLAELRAELDSDFGFGALTEQGRANAELTRSYAVDAKAQLVNLAGVATTTEADMAKAVAATREEFIKSGMAAGFSRKEIVARANELGLTPKLVRTVFEEVGIDAATLKAREARKAYLALPKDVRTALRADGVPKTMGQVDALVAKYKLTEKERRALVSLKDNATAAGKMIQRLLEKISDTDWDPTIKAETDQATRNLRLLLGFLDAIPRNVTTTITTMRRTVGTGVGPAYNAEEKKKAGGGQVRGPGTTTSDSIPAWLSDREYVVQAAAVDHYGLGFFDELNAMRAPVGPSGLALAAGGVVACGAVWGMGVVR